MSDLFEVKMPDGSVVRKRVYKDRGGDVKIATAFIGQNGKPCVSIWPGSPAWEGTFGRLVAVRVKEGGAT